MWLMDLEICDTIVNKYQRELESLSEEVIVQSIFLTHKVNCFQTKPISVNTVICIVAHF